MSGGTIAGLIAAGAFVLLVLLLAVPLLKLGRVLDEATLAIRKTSDGAVPLLKLGRVLDEATLAIRKTSDGAVPLLSGAQVTLDQVNTQLGEVEGITKSVGNITTNAAALTSIVSSTVGGPLIKVAAFSYGVRKTVQARRDGDAAPGRHGRRRAR